MLELWRAGDLRRPVLVLILAAAAMVGASCYSTSYSKEVAANTDLIAGLADKLADYCKAGFVVDDRQISSEEMGEFYYALKKARAFAYMRRDDSNRTSYRDFVALLDRYSAFVHSADQYRISGQVDSETLAALTSEHDAVDQAASRVRADLRSES
jgi:hypothetical protein